MTRRTATPDACFDPAHGHEVVARRRDLGGGWSVTAWLCPVRRTVSAVFEDDQPPDRPPGGPLDRLG
jgi:hypothetical protein